MADAFTVDIQAPAEVAWQILTDLPRYPEWNPLIPRAVGRLEPGQDLEFTARVGRWVRTQRQTVYEVVENRKLVWSGAEETPLGELVRGVRTQTLTPLGPDRCRYTSTEVFTGPAAGLTRRLYGDTLHAGIRAMGEALRDRAEAQVGVEPRSRPPIHLPADDARTRLPHRPGWYAALPGDQLAPGTAKAVQLAGRDLLVWRTRGGRVGAARNVCGHLAARLSPRARVDGELLVCGHHGAHFAATGAACDHAVRSLQAVPVRDVGPVVMVWHHPEDAAPSFSLPDMGDPSFGAYSWQSFDLPIHPQHVMQDLADVAHFRSVHGYRSVETLQPLQARGPVLTFAAEAGWDPGHPRLPSVPVRFRCAAHGVGFQVTEVRGPGGLTMSRHLVLPSPMDDHTTRLWLGVATRVSPRIHARLGPATRLFRAAVQAGVHRAFRRDVLRDASLWTARVHLGADAPPADPAHQAFVRWAEQFTVAPEAGRAERAA